MRQMMFRISAILVCTLFITTAGHGQYNERYKAKNEWIKTGASFTLLLGAGWIPNSVTPFTAQQLETLDLNQVPRFERFVTNNWSPKHAKVSDYLLYGSFAIPVFSALAGNPKSDVKPLAHMYLQAFFVNTALTQATKGLSHRTRPYVYNPDAPEAKKLERDARLSFVSGHTSTTAANCFLAASWYSYYHKDPTSRAMVWTAAVLYPALTGYLRIRSGKHFVTDVVGGYILGAAIGIGVPWAYQRFNKPNTP
ncbi:MAG: phosphatase PAP2 family protein [Flavobacteriales bacterium]|nr:phosphatase PAP2 family protein [Flavobacteriales bacterium]